jgi:type IV pilus assembly protein PilY1
MSASRHRIATLVLAGALGILATPAAAEDIDIFAGSPYDTDLPNVLIIWDNSANWSANIPVPNCSYVDGGGTKADSPNKEQGTKMAIEKCALYNAIHGLPTQPDGSAMFNVALMLFNESPAGISGGYPRQRFLPMTAANKDLLKATIRNITIGGDKGNNAAFTKSLHEAYLMFSKAVPYRGTSGTKYDPLAVLDGRYVGPAGTGCGTNHIIVLANGGPGEVTDNEAMALLSGVGGSTEPLTYPSSLVSNSDQGNWADEYARFLSGTDIVGTKEGTQSVTTHAIAVIGSSSDGRYPNFMQAIATQGGGQYYKASNVSELSDALFNIIPPLKSAKNSAFASASLPVSANSQGSYKNQVLVGMFRPDVGARPRWVGNLKQYKIAYDRVTDTMQLIDSMGSPALTSATGFFRGSAISYWTEESTFFVNDPKGDPKSSSDRPDGWVVEKGAVAQDIRTLHATHQADRKVFTCVGCADGTLLRSADSERFLANNPLLTKERFGVSTDAERDLLVAWIRGTDNVGDEKGPGGTTTVRPSVHGDVLHSRPAVVDYAGSIGTVAFYGSNDGMIRAVDANQTGETAGRELWAFVPEEFLGKFKRFRSNLPYIRFPSTPTAANAVARDYFIDGPVTVYQRVDETGAAVSVQIFVSMRRGGRLLYAFDVTDPLSPRLLWRKSHTDISGLGQTWSEPRVTRLKGYSRPVLVLGAGYDAIAEDALPPGTTTMGNAVLVLDSSDGSVIARFATTRSVPAPVALLDTDFDGYVDRAYAADAGGNVYRIDFETAAGDGNPAGWTIRTFATLDGGAGRKFFYAPDIVHTSLFTAVMLGSGNRERPLATTTSDRFYTLFDYKVAKGTPTASAIANDTLVPYSASFELTSSVTGCYLALAAGEKVVTSAATTGGNTYFSTNRPTPPAPEACSNLGIAKGYRVPLFCGAAEWSEFAGGGLPPSPVIGEVEVTVPGPDGGEETRKLPFIIGGVSPELSGLSVSRVPIKVDPQRNRTYWFNKLFK